ncbi:MAG: thioredoxin-like domain-containing protein [Bacteroidota bacterium]
MKKIAVLLVCCISAFIGRAQTQVQFVPADSIYNIINHPPDSITLVINFWATWCKPCLEELPYFNQADSILKGEPYRFIYISLDPPSDKTGLVKFVNKRNLTGTHYHLNATDLNEFINKVDPNWQGSIPYTIVLSTADRQNHEGAFEDFKQLWQFIRHLGED